MCKIPFKKEDERKEKARERKQREIKEERRKGRRKYWIYEEEILQDLETTSFAFMPSTS